MTTVSWLPVRPDLAGSLGDARLQVHHAAQLATAFGISYLPPQPDDSHTNLEWLQGRGTLASNPLQRLRVELRVSTLTLALQGTQLGLDGKTIPEAAGWLRERLSAAGLDGARYTLERHYEIPSHGVARGEPFRASSEHLEEVSRWFANAALVLGRLEASDSRASEVRCWPHHFDIATLITVRPGHTVGVGLEPGDAYYGEPYFYVNMNPMPPAGALADAKLRGGGIWHTREWIGAVLPGSHLAPGEAAQQAQVAEFIDSAVGAATTLVR